MYSLICIIKTNPSILFGQSQCLVARYGELNDSVCLSGRKCNTRFSSLKW